MTISDSTTSTTVWDQVLEQLHPQMTRATFDAWVANTWLIEHAAGDLVIGVPSDSAKEWLENRLASTIQRAAGHVLGQPDLVLRFVVAAQPLPPASPPPTEALHAADLPPALQQQTLTPGQIAARNHSYNIFFGKDTRIGYAMISHYNTFFWQPYLGPAYMLWKRLDSNSRVSLEKPQHRWSEPQLITYNSLANAMNYPHIRYICGSIMECSRSIEAIRQTDQPIERCCFKHPEIRTKTDRRGRDRCFYWYVGQLETLYHEGLVALEVQTGPHPRNHTVHLQLWRFLPLLTPVQVGRLNSELQKSHADWLRDFGRLFDLEISAWQSIAEFSLVPLLDGYVQYRQLHQDHNFAANFLKLPNARRIGFYDSES